MIKIRIVGIATPNLFKINLIIKDEKKKKHRTIGAFFKIKIILQLCIDYDYTNFAPHYDMAILLIEY